MKSFICFSFQSNLPALFPISNLFELVQGKSETDEAADVPQGSEMVDDEEKCATKKDKRKLRHKKFLKSENFCGSSRFLYFHN